MKKFFQIAFCMYLAMVISSCKNKHFDESVETMNKGEIEIYADDAYRVIVGELVKSYENVYPEAKINVIYSNENDVMNAMLSGKTRMIITGKQLSETEKARIAKVNGIEAQVSPIAREAIAVITSAQSEDTVFDYDAFMTSGNNPSAEKNVSDKYVFLKGQTSFVNQVIGGTTTAGFTNIFSLENADTLIHYIQQTKNSFGFISFALLSDADDPKTREILSRVKVLSVMKDDSTGTARIYELSQSSIAADEYPLQRSIYVVKGNMAQSLGTGFVNFMYRSKASRIFLKSGLIPEVMPERQILIKE